MPTYLKGSILLKNPNTLSLGMSPKIIADSDKINIRIRINMNNKTKDNLNMNTKIHKNKLISKTRSNKPGFLIKDNDQIKWILKLWVQCKDNRVSKIKINQNINKTDLQLLKINNSQHLMQINFSKNMDLKTHSIKRKILK